MSKIECKDIEQHEKAICPECYAILVANNSAIPVQGEHALTVTPKLWKHSENDLFHAWIKAYDRYVILCGSREFDEKTLKRIRPILKEENDFWTISVKGKIYEINEVDEDSYVILDDNGQIVKDEEVEAKVFTYMLSLKTQSPPQLY